MKNTILRIAVLAAFAMVLLAGSAMAGSMGVCKDDFGVPYACEYIEGKISFNRNLSHLTTNAAGDVVSFGVRPLRLADHEDALGNITSPSGTFADLLTVPVGAIDPSMPANVSMDMFMRDQWTYDQLDTFVWDTVTNPDLGFISLPPFNKDETFFLGEFDGFSFWISMIDWDPNSNMHFYDEVTGRGNGGLQAFGWVGYVDYEWTEADFSFSWDKVAGADTWNFSIDVVAKGAPSDVPEPGTLVLLGTGLLGAAVIARKKIKK